VDSSEPLDARLLAVIQKNSQISRFRALLHHVWSQSPFYRDYYTAHGIRHADLAEIQVCDVPSVDKRMLMDNFDDIVTEPALSKSDIESWVRADGGYGKYKGSWVVLVSSGVSGVSGLSVYSEDEWRYMHTVAAPYQPAPIDISSRKTRVAVYKSISSHGAGVTVALHMRELTNEVLILPLEAPAKSTIEQLQAFQPDRIVGYSSAVAQLAEWQLSGRLRIKPENILCGGDMLTSAMEETILAAWDRPVYNGYGCSECVYLAMKDNARDDMSVMTELILLEAVDARGQQASAGVPGEVLVTNLFNFTLPFIRYPLDDLIVPGKVSDNGSVATIAELNGKVGAGLPITLDNGSPDAINAMILDTLVSGIRKLQFVSNSPASIRVDYVADENVDTGLRAEVMQKLRQKSASHGRGGAGIGRGQR
jgi:phenylacetate-CoA ligase